LKSLLKKVIGCREKMNKPPARNVADLLGIHVVGYEVELREQVKRPEGI